MKKPLDNQFCIYIIILALVIPCCTTRNGLNNTDLPRSDSAENLYYTMCIKPGVDLVSRRNAATALASHPRGGPWIIMRLADDDVTYRYSGPAFTDKSRKMKLAVTKKFENTITSSLIKGLPDTPETAILWALTFRLDDKGIGRFSERVIDPETGEELFVEYVTDPIADSARSVLIRAVGEDFQYDKRRWRIAIGQMIETE